MSGTELLRTLVLVALGMGVTSVITKAIGVDSDVVVIACALVVGAIFGLVLRTARRIRGRDTEIHRARPEPPTSAT